MQLTCHRQPAKRNRVFIRAQTVWRRRAPHHRTWRSCWAVGAETKAQQEPSTAGSATLSGSVRQSRCDSVCPSVDGLVLQLVRPSTALPCSPAACVLFCRTVRRGGGGGGGVWEGRPSGRSRSRGAGKSGAGRYRADRSSDRTARRYRHRQLSAQTQPLLGQTRESTPRPPLATPATH